MDHDLWSRGHDYRFHLWRRNNAMALWYHANSFWNHDRYRHRCYSTIGNGGLWDVSRDRLGNRLDFGDRQYHYPDYS